MNWKAKRWQLLANRIVKAKSEIASLFSEDEIKNYRGLSNDLSAAIVSLRSAESKAQSKQSEEQVRSHYLGDKDLRKGK